MIREVDRARYAYHKHFAKYAPGDPQHKHIIINSALLEVEGTAQALASIARQKFGSPEESGSVASSPAAAAESPKGEAEK